MATVVAWGESQPFMVAEYTVNRRWLLLRSRALLPLEDWSPLSVCDVQSRSSLVLQKIKREVLPRDVTDFY